MPNLGSRGDRQVAPHHSAGTELAKLGLMKTMCLKGSKREVYKKFQSKSPLMSHPTLAF